MWEAKNVHVNALSSIVLTLEKTIKALKTSPDYEYYFDLCLNKLPNVIDAVQAGTPRSFIGLPDTLLRLQACMPLIKDHEVQKELLMNKILSLRAVLS